MGVGWGGGRFQAGSSRASLIVEQQASVIAGGLAAVQYGVFGRPCLPPLPHRQKPPPGRLFTERRQRETAD